MKLENGTLIVAEVDSTQYAIIKSWNMMRWNKQTKWLEGAATGELLDRLASMVRLPEQIETERQRMIAVRKAVDAERLMEEPTEYKFPVKIPLFKHQQRGAVMALLTFGLLDPSIVQVQEKPKPETELVQKSLDRFFAYIDGDEEAFSDDWKGAEDGKPSKRN